MPYASNGFRRRVALAVLLASSGAACGGTAPPSYPATIQEGRSAADDMLGLGMGSAIAIALVDRDGTAWSEGFGLTDREAGTAATSATLFSIASASKTLAAVVVMRLVDRGLVDLDAPLVRYLPAFTMQSPAHVDVTVRMLLDHSSGLPGTDYRNVQTRVARTDYLDQVMATLSGEWLKATPGYTNAYCNDGYTLLEAVVQAVTGRSYVDVAREEVLVPLGMASTRFALEPLPEGSWAKAYANGVVQPQDFLDAFGSGGAWSSADDMARLARMFLGAGALDGQRVLSAPAVDAMAEDSTVGRFHPVRQGAMAFGLGWDSVAQPGLAAVGQRGWSKGGDSELGHYGASIVVAPDAGLAAVVLGTAGLGSAGANLVAERVLLRALAETGRIPSFPRPLPRVIPPRAAVPDGLLASMAGVYAGEGGLFLLEGGPDGELVASSAVPAPEAPGGSPLAWVPVNFTSYRSDATFVADVRPLDAYRVTRADGRRFLARRAPAGYGHYLDESVFADGIDPGSAPLSPAWSARMGGQWLVVNVSPDSVAWPQADPRLRLAEVPGLTGRIAVLPRGGAPAVLDPSGDDRVARTMQPGGRDLDDLVALERDGEEWMRLGSFLHRPLDSVPRLAPGATTAVIIGPEGYAEWRAVVPTASTLTVRIAGARAWALHGPGFTSVQGGGATGTVEVPAGGASHLEIHGAPGSRVSVSVDGA